MRIIMYKVTMILALIGLGVAVFGIPAFTQGKHTELAESSLQEEHGARDSQKAANKDGDIDKLYELVLQARADIEALRVQAGIRREGAEGWREGRGEHGAERREGRGEHGEGGREGRGEHGEGGREGRGEHGEGGREVSGESGSDEEGGKRLTKTEKWDETRNGARLVIAYSAATQSFRGIVLNTTSKTLSEVRVEVHLSNGVELGPTKRVDLKPGAKIPVELSAANQEFTWWTTHPEHGSEEGHGPGHEGGESEGSGEHGEGGGNRPTDPALRPLYNQLQLLRQEIKMVARGLQERKR